MFIQTQKTPNPNSLKFLPGKKISDADPMEFTSKEKNESPLIRNILSVDGVESIFLGSDFLSVNKKENVVSNIKKYVNYITIINYISFSLNSHFT